MITISDQEIKQMTKPNGFIAVWFRYLKDCRTHQDAYDKAEVLYHSYFGVRRYKNFEAFKAAKAYHDKRMKV